MINEVQRLREITETLTNRAYLIDQAEECQYAFDAIPECILVVDTNEVIRFANKSLVKRLGMNCDAPLYDRDFSAICAPSELNLSILDEDEELEIYIKRLGGWFLCSKSPIYSNVWRLIGFVVVLRDITEVKEVQRALKASENRYRAIFEHSMDALVLIDGTGKIIEYNNKTKELFECKDPTIFGENLIRFFPEIQPNGERSDRYFMNFMARLTGSNEVVFELAGRKCDGSDVVLIVKLSRIAYLNSEFILVVISDVTAVRKLETRCRLLSADVRDIVWQTDLNLSLEFVSQSVLGMLGYTVKEFLGSNLCQHMAIGDFLKLKGIIDASLGNADFNGVIFEADLKHKNGKPVHVEIHGQHIKDAGGNIVGLQGVVAQIEMSCSL